ncbi:hypothetical protein Hanom_Chr02g00148041 [Helianthus anomalus]
MFVRLTYRTKFLVRVCSLIKQTKINELPAKRFTNCSLNVRFVYRSNTGLLGTFVFCLCRCFNKERKPVISSGGDKFPCAQAVKAASSTKGTASRISQAGSLSRLAQSSGMDPHELLLPDAE